MSVNPLDEHQPDRTERNRNHEARARFLAGANDLLTQTTRLIGAALDEESTLAGVARLALPHAGVWSVLDVRFGSAKRRIVVSDHFPRHGIAAEALARGWPSVHDGADPGARVLRKGRSALIPAVTDGMLLQVADSPRQMLLLRELDIGSALTVSLTTGVETIGALTFFAPHGGTVFDEADRLLAEDVAAGAALALVNARLNAADEETRTAEREAAAERFAFLSSFSHGLRTPLHAIQGYAQLLAEGVHGPLSEGQRNYVQRIQANERRVLRLVHSAVGYAQWDDDDLLLEDVRGRTAVRQASAAVVRIAKAKGVLFRPERDVPGDQLVVRAEPRRLREILLQLMLNAVKYSGPGDTLVIDALAVGERVWIRVTDTGVGIARQELESIFLPFRHANQNSPENGAGLGLAVTQKLARAMGGELLVRSDPGQGSTFTLALPRGRLPLMTANDRTVNVAGGT